MTGATGHQRAGDVQGSGEPAKYGSRLLSVLAGNRGLAKAGSPAAAAGDMGGRQASRVRALANPRKRARKECPTIADADYKEMIAIYGKAWLKHDKVARGGGKGRVMTQADTKKAVLLAVLAPECAISSALKEYYAFMDGVPAGHKESLLYKATGLHEKLRKVEDDFKRLRAYLKREPHEMQDWPVDSPTEALVRWTNIRQRSGVPTRSEVSIDVFNACATAGLAAREGGSDAPGAVATSAAAAAAAAPGDTSKSTGGSGAVVSDGQHSGTGAASGPVKSGSGDSGRAANGQPAADAAAGCRDCDLEEALSAGVDALMLHDCPSMSLPLRLPHDGGDDDDAAVYLALNLAEHAPDLDDMVPPDYPHKHTSARQSAHENVLASNATTQHTNEVEPVFGHGADEHHFSHESLLDLLGHLSGGGAAAGGDRPRTFEENIHAWIDIPVDAALSPFGSRQLHGLPPSVCTQPPDMNSQPPSTVPSMLPSAGGSSVPGSAPSSVPSSGSTRAVSVHAALGSSRHTSRHTSRLSNSMERLPSLDLLRRSRPPSMQAPSMDGQQEDDGDLGCGVGGVAPGTAVGDREMLAALCQQMKAMQESLQQIERNVASLTAAMAQLVKKLPVDRPGADGA